LLQKNSFGYSTLNGFDLFYAQESSISGRFIEEVKSTSTYMSPLGVEVTNVLVIHKIVTFSFFHQKESHWLLRIDGNPRSLKIFVRSLSGILDFGFSIAPIITPVLDVFDYLKRTGVVINRVTALLASNIIIGNGGIGKIEVRAVSGSDALEEFDKSFKKNEHVLERISLFGEFDGIGFSGSISRTGGLSFNDEIDADFTALYIEYLKNIKNPK
jgi:hypothetical protein